MPCQLRTKPEDPVISGGEIRRIEHSRLDEVQNGPINLWPLRLHEVKHEFRRSVPAFMHDADGWVVAISNRFDPQFAFKDRIGIIQNGVDRMRALRLPAKWNGEERCSIEVQLSGIGLRLVPRHLIGMPCQERK